MKARAIQQKMAWLLAVAGAGCLLFADQAFSAGAWVDEIWNMVAFEKANYPTSDFAPYYEQLERIREGLDRGDQSLAKAETDRFLRMLQERVHGISDVAADELYNFTLGVRPAGSDATVGAIELGIDNERPMSVPDHTVQTPYEGGPPCKEGGCDYWIDDVYDPGASG